MNTRYKAKVEAINGFIQEYMFTENMCTMTTEWDTNEKCELIFEISISVEDASEEKIKPTRKLFEAFFKALEIKAEIEFHKWSWDRVEVME